jgi:ABC-2 type transport system permease protein
MRRLRLLCGFARSSAQNEMAHRANLGIAVLHSIVSLGTGVLGLLVLFGQVQAVRGWDLPSTLALLGVYQIVSAVRGLCIGPSLESLAGADGEIMTGRLDYTLLRPVSTQFLASFRCWKPLTLLDLALGLGVLAASMAGLGKVLTVGNAVSFLVALAAGIVVLYSILLGLTALTLWSPGFLFTWAFDALYQMARYPVGIYPGWLRLALTWIVPVGIMTSVPAQALSGGLSAGMLAASVALAAALCAGASLLFRRGLRRYAGASG